MDVNLFAKQILLPDGWRQNVRLSIDSTGNISDVETQADSSNVDAVLGTVIPGMPNLHSHAFQRAMTGLTEHAIAGKNDFWSWRETMYGFANRMTTDDIRIVALQLYMEMLKAGYTSVAEFHYLHHDQNGEPYDRKDELAQAIASAAKESGIGLTLLPVLYMTGDLDNSELKKEQRRFGHNLDTYLGFLDSLKSFNSDQLRLGIAFHSLRAVPMQAILSVCDFRAGHMDGCPVHIHIAEQTKEVDDCRTQHRSTPVNFLFANINVDLNWCLVHATHIDKEELELINNSQCTVGLCPTTEANLGDGIFPLHGLLEGNGVFGIGSDSHISVSPVEELRWLEYGQRLHLQKRNVAANRKHTHTGQVLWDKALVGGSQATGRATGKIQRGKRADLVVLDDEHPLLQARENEFLMDTFIFAGNQSLVRDVMVGGQWLVKAGHHKDEESISSSFNHTLNKLSNHSWRN